MAFTKEELEILKHLVKREIEHFLQDEKKAGSVPPSFLAKEKLYEGKLKLLLKKFK